MTLDEVLHSKRYALIYILARYFYRIGEPIVSDEYYDRLDIALRKKHPNLLVDYYNRTYDDDPVPEDLLRSLGIEPIFVVSKEERENLYASLDEDKSNSMQPVRTVEEVWEWFRFLKQQEQDVVASLKIDGVNKKSLYRDGNFVLSMSRGRHGNSFDYTEASKLFVPKHLDVLGDVKVVGECYVEESALDALKKKYNTDKFKTPKSSAVSMLRVLHDVEDYSFLHYRVFYADGVANTLTETLKKMESFGFEVVPYLLISHKDVPETFETFSEWLNILMEKIAEMGSGIKSDGMALEVNDLSWSGEQHGAYNSRQLAVKFGQWGFHCYEGEITGISVEQRRVYKAVRIFIKPIKTDDGCKAVCINSFNPSILIENDLYVGKRVFFEKNSGAVNILIHGKRLEAILEEGEQHADDV